MHSTTLRGSDFELLVNGTPQPHADFFSHVDKQLRLGVVAPRRVDGVGATTLIMAYITAFYDAYRTEGNDFFAYPDYFTFQPTAPVAHYTMLDIWPNHKDVLVLGSHVDMLNALNDRAVNVLLLPEATTPNTKEYERPQLESARRNIIACYLYTFNGTVADADLIIRCAKNPIVPWATTVFETNALDGDSTITQLKSAWEKHVATAPTLTQSFRHVPLNEALQHL